MKYLTFLLKIFFIEFISISRNLQQTNLQRFMWSALYKHT